MASMVSLSCGLNCPLPVSMLRVTWKIQKETIATKLEGIISWRILQTRNYIDCNRNWKWVRKQTCPSAIISKTWYWPPLLSTIPIAVSMIGANEVGPVTHYHHISAKWILLCCHMWSLKQMMVHQPAKLSCGTSSLYRASACSKPSHGWLSR